MNYSITVVERMDKMSRPVPKYVSRADENRARMAALGILPIPSSKKEEKEGPAKPKAETEDNTVETEEVQAPVAEQAEQSTPQQKEKEEPEKTEEVQTPVAEQQEEKEEPQSNNSTQTEQQEPDNNSSHEKLEGDEKPKEPPSKDSTKIENTKPTQPEEKTEGPQASSSSQKQESETEKPEKPIVEGKEKAKSKKYSRIIQNAKERTVVAPSPTTTVKPTVAYISKEDREKGDNQFQENLKTILDNSTLMDVLISHKDTIKNLRARGYGDDVICKLFMDSYSFPTVTPVDIEYALKTPRRKKSA